VAAYLDLMVDLLLVRRLQPWSVNVGKRLVKSPRVYVRDTGLLHALLGLETLDDVLGHPVVGASWEGFAIETLIANAPDGTEAHFYRTSAGAEIDLLLTLPGQRRWAIEIKRSLTPKLDRGFYGARQDIGAERSLVVYAGSETYPIGDRITALSLRALAGQLAAA
jgi:predicted AAA+ superfamily ATPase